MLAKGGGGLNAGSALQSPSEAAGVERGKHWKVQGFPGGLPTDAVGTEVTWGREGATGRGPKLRATEQKDSNSSDWTDKAKG